MADIVEETCPRCNGDKAVLKGIVVGGLAQTEVCPRCAGKGMITIEKKQHSHFEPTELRK